MVDKTRQNLCNNYFLTCFSERTQTPDAKRKVPFNNKTSTMSQTSPSVKKSNENVDSVDEHHWEKEAEKRRDELEVSLTENQELYERISSLEEELNMSESLIIEAQNVVDILTDILKEDEAEIVTEESGANQTDNNDNEEESLDKNVSSS